MQKIIASAHSMDTSFYALQDGYLVEFLTGEPGIVPEGFPEREEIRSDLSEIVIACIKTSAIKRKIKELEEKYRSDAEKLFRECPEDILRNYFFIYRIASNDDYILAFLEGESDQYGNDYKYELIGTPEEMPKKMIKSIQEKLVYLPKINLEETILFKRHEVISYYNSEIDYYLIREAIKWLVNKHKEDTLWNLLQEKSLNFLPLPGLAIINTCFISCQQLATITVISPNFGQIIKDQNIVCLSCSRYNDILGILKNIAPQSVVFFDDDIDDLVDELRSFYQTKVKVTIKEKAFIKS